MFNISTLLFYISRSFGYRHRNPNINIREIIWLGNQLWLTWTTKPWFSPVDPGATNQSVPTSAERMFSIGNFELSRLLLTFTTLGWIGLLQSNRKINLEEYTILPILPSPAWSSPTSLHPLSNSHNLPCKGKRSSKRRRKCIFESSL